MVTEYGCAVMVPKVEDRDTLNDLALPVTIPLVETPTGVLNAAEIY
ncbi:hypothetical protein [Nocardia jiangxiensis]|uniref:Uncharacterized protein n=1 Tax=Nocardia jiangxiensis TaxID=282685 RepID=A0ABW6SFP8_9NOCA|nr:hypothetical protein [Nocardia jiangxiensis]